LRVARAVRTSDVADALDSMGMQERFQMDPAMRPLFPGLILFTEGERKERSPNDQEVKREAVASG
jgi:hypothetical protein